MKIKLFTFSVIILMVLSSITELSAKSYKEASAQFMAGYTMPFPNNVKNMGRYGAKAELGFVTKGTIGFYSALGYQFTCLSTNNTSGLKTYYREHDLMIPLQFSVRAKPGLPFQFRVGPFIGFNLYTVKDTNGSKVKLTQDIPFKDIFLCGLQASVSFCYVTVCYTLERNPMFSTHLDTHLLTFGFSF